MTKYRKKPVVVEALEYTGDNFHALREFLADAKWHWNCTTDKDDRTIQEVHISTLEGEMTAMPGDYIIKGVKGEFYPCKPDIFEQTYERLEEGEKP